MAAKPDRRELRRRADDFLAIKSPTDLAALFHLNEAALHAVDYWQVIKNRYGIILLTLLLVFMTASVITYVMPKKYQSEAIIEVRPRSISGGPLGNEFGGAIGSTPMTPQFFGTEFEKIKSSKSLYKVVVAHAKPQKKATGKRLRERALASGHRHGITRINVGDAGGEPQFCRNRKARRRGHERIASNRFGEPDR